MMCVIVTKDVTNAVREKTNGWLPVESKAIYQDSYTAKITNNSTLKVYLDMTDLKKCEEKLKNFAKVKRFIHELNKF